MKSETSAKRLLESVNQAQGIDKLLAVMAALRDPDGGCPWDIQQSYQSILPFTIEEVYEVAEAIENNDYSELKVELGDLLFQVVFYAQIAKEEARFEFNDIVDSICDKLVRRHPHVFADQQYSNEKALKQAWESHKEAERAEKSAGVPSVLDDIPKALPELKRALKIQKRVAKLGFDWENVDQVWDKVDEEAAEIKQAAAQPNADQSRIEDEIGDMFFALVNLSRHYGVDADIALRRANQKFDRRFREVEKAAQRPLSDYSLVELEALWQNAKQITEQN